MDQRSMLLSVSILVGGLITLAVSVGVPTAARLPALGDLMPALAGPPESVVVVLIPDPRALSSLYGQLRPEQIAFLDRQAIALTSQQILALDDAAASRALNGAGWTERPIEMFDASGGPAAADRHPPRRAPGDISDLFAKPELSRAEAARVLEYLASQP